MGFVGACRPLGTMGVPAATRARHGETAGRGGHLLPEMAGQRLGDRISRSIILSRLRVGETWLPVKTEPTAGDGGVLAVTLMKASSCNCCRPTRAAPGETLDPGIPDRTMAVLSVSLSLIRAWFLSSCWREDAGGAVFHVTHQRHGVSVAWRDRVSVTDV